MRVEGDRIIFESRREIESIQIALEEYLKASENKDVKRLNDLLDVMHLNW